LGSGMTQATEIDEIDKPVSGASVYFRKTGKEPGHAATLVGSARAGQTGAGSDGVPAAFFRFGN